MADARFAPAVTPNRTTADSGFMAAHSTRDGALFVSDWIQGLIIEGRGYMIQSGTEDAPSNSTVKIDPQLTWQIIDVPVNIALLPFWAQAVQGLWGAGTKLNYMIEIDNAKNRDDSSGTAFTPLNLNTASSNVSATSAYVNTTTAAGITTLSKTTDGSLEVYRESIEVNVGDKADYWPHFEWKPRVIPVVEGLGAIVTHLGWDGGDTQSYGSIMWCEVPATMVS